VAPKGSPVVTKETFVKQAAVAEQVSGQTEKKDIYKQPINEKAIVTARQSPVHNV